jgi:hypothetical protein
MAVPLAVSLEQPRAEGKISFVKYAYMREPDVLDSMIAEATSKNDSIARRRAETKAWAQQKMAMLNRYANAQCYINFKEIFKQAYKAQRQHALPPEVPSLQTAVRSLSPMGWFFEGLDTSVVSITLCVRDRSCTALSDSYVSLSCRLLGVYAE